MCLSATLLSGAVFAQDVFLEQWKRRAGAQPAGISFTIVTPQTTFYWGQIIPLQLKFVAIQPQTFLADSRLYDRVGRMNYVEEFVVDPVSHSEDPLKGLPGGEGAMGGLSGGFLPLSEKPFEFERVLNEWVRFRSPGTYRVYVLSRRVTQNIEMRAARNPVELVSNILTFDVRKAPPKWQSDQLSAAKKILDGPSDSSERTRNDRLRAIRVLRFLESPEAAAELARRLSEGQDVDSYSAHMGVLASPYRKQLLPFLEQRLVAPDQPVWERYFDTLTRLSELVASGGPMPSYPSDAAAQAVWREESKRRAGLQDRKRDESAARLVASLPAKQPQARAVSLNTLLSFGTHADPAPPWLAGVTASLISDFHDLPDMTQSTLLEYRWNLLRGPSMLPILRQIIARPPPQTHDPSVESVALQRLYELSPAEARNIILEEIRDPTRRMPFHVLAMLPDDTIPELDDPLVSRFDQLLILRYATGKVVKRVEDVYLARDAEIKRQNLPTCAGPLAFYFLKYDPPFGERLLRGDFAKPAGVPACYDIGFQFLQWGRWAYSPALESLAIDSLTSPKVPVKRGAAEVLGKYGTPAAEKPLWDAMEYFHSWWKGHEDQLKEKNGQEGMQLERALRIALARADAWALQDQDLRHLLTLCSSDWCRTEVNQWITAAQAPPKIEVSPTPDGFAYSVAQYGPGSAEWLERKLHQYPPGTAFTVAAGPYAIPPPGIREARERAQEIVRAAGRKLAE